MCRGVELWKQEQREFGRKEGIELGIQQGIQQGVQQGVQRGVEIDRKEIILSMLGNDFSPDRIHQVTNIPLKQVLDVAAVMGIRGEK